MSEKLQMSDIQYVKIVHIGGINPNNPLSDAALVEQQKLLNRCLNDIPKGIIIGKDKTIANYMIGEHQLIMERTSYHIGFPRKPSWIKD